jgi:hypothetical protein
LGDAWLGKCQIYPFKLYRENKKKRRIKNAKKRGKKAQWGRKEEGEAVAPAAPISFPNGSDKEGSKQSLVAREEHQRNKRDEGSLKMA